LKHFSEKNIALTDIGKIHHFHPDKLDMSPGAFVRLESGVSDLQLATCNQASALDQRLTSTIDNRVELVP
jgi:hypothetical protein